jgi:hypothetical protein
MRIGVAIAILIFGFGESAFAQFGPGRGRRQMDPQSRETVWNLQSKAAAKSLDLPQEAADKLAAAYKVSRERLQKAIEATPPAEGGGWRERMDLFRKNRDLEREALAKDLAGFLDDGQAKKVMEILGLLSNQWDFMTKTLSDIVTQEDKLLKAILVVNSHLGKVEGQFAATPPSEGSGEDLRERFRQSREALNAEMAKILSEEELKKWQESTERRQGRP